MSPLSRTGDARQDAARTLGAAIFASADDLTRQFEDAAAVLQVPIRSPLRLNLFMEPMFHAVAAVRWAAYRILRPEHAGELVDTLTNLIATGCTSYTRPEDVDWMAHREDLGAFLEGWFFRRFDQYDYTRQLISTRVLAFIRGGRSVDERILRSRMKQILNDDGVKLPNVLLREFVHRSVSHTHEAFAKYLQEITRLPPAA